MNDKLDIPYVHILVKRARKRRNKILSRNRDISCFVRLFLILTKNKFYWNIYQKSTDEKQGIIG